MWLKTYDNGGSPPHPVDGRLDLSKVVYLAAAFGDPDWFINAQLVGGSSRRVSDDVYASRAAAVTAIEGMLLP